MDGSLEVATTKPSPLERLRSTEAVAALRRTGIVLVGMLVALTVRVRDAIVVRTRRIRTYRMPVAYRAYAMLQDDIGIVERRSIDIASRIQNREERVRTYLELARLADQLRRSPGPAFAALCDEFRDHVYWTIRPDRTILAARLTCSAASLAAVHGEDTVSRDAYLLGQTFYGKVGDTDRKIGLAVAFSDASRLMGSLGDQASWLATAMDLACGIMDRDRRIGGVQFVAEKMVATSIPPALGNQVRERFDIDAGPHPAPELDIDDEVPELEFHTI